MGSVKLSFCIPTYNRGVLLDKTIESIIKQLDESHEKTVEICISDNASTDNTDEIIKKWKKNSPVKIIYHKNEINLGADKNFMKAVEIASGDYCWLFGSDDILKNNAVNRIFKELEEEHTIYLCNRIECDFNMNPLRIRKWLDVGKDRVFDLNKKEELQNYFNSSMSLGAVFSYLSSIIIHRESWNKAKLDESFIGSAYSHVYKILKIITTQKNCKLKYIDDELVLCRGDNDSFAQEGFIKRVLIDLEGYTKLANVFFNEDPDLKKSFLNILKNDYPFYRVLKIFAKCKNDPKCEQNYIKEKLNEIGYKNGILSILAFSGSRFDKFVETLILLKRKTSNLKNA